MDVRLLSDRQLLVRFYACDQLMSVATQQDFEEARRDLDELEAEIDRRFGEGASDRLAGYTTAWRFSPVEMLDWAADHIDECVEVAKTGDCKNPKGSLLAR